MCSVESAPINAASQEGLSVEHRKYVLDTMASCTPFLRHPDGSPMKEDMATYYKRIQCPIDKLFLLSFDSQRGSDMFNELVVKKHQDASLCHGFVELLSLIDAYGLTNDMCEDRVLVSEMRVFCNKRHQGDNLVKMFAQLQYVRLEAVADLLLNFVDKEECSQVCGGLIDSALCNGFLDVAKFFSDRVSQGGFVIRVICIVMCSLVSNVEKEHPVCTDTLPLKEPACSGSLLLGLK